MAMLTTVDNPYSPYEDFGKWYMYDCELGYNTSGYLVHVIDKLCEDPNLKKHYEYFDDYDHYVTNLAMQEIVKNDFMDIYRIVENDFDDSDADKEYEEFEDEERMDIS